MAPGITEVRQVNGNTDMARWVATCRVCPWSSGYYLSTRFDWHYVVKAAINHALTQHVTPYRRHKGLF